MACGSCRRALLGVDAPRLAQCGLPWHGARGTFGMTRVACRCGNGVRPPTTCFRAIGTCGMDELTCNLEAWDGYECLRDGGCVRRRFAAGPPSATAGSAAGCERGWRCDGEHALVDGTQQPAACLAACASANRSQNGRKSWEIQRDCLLSNPRPTSGRQDASAWPFLIGIQRSLRPQQAFSSTCCVEGPLLAIS